MLFSSILFISVFLPVTVALYFISPGTVLKNFVLLAVSCLFYFWGEGVYILVMGVSILIAWIFGCLIDRAMRPSAKRASLIAGVGSALALLIFFKYANFICDNLNALLSDVNFVRLERIHLPIGISFFTFQVISYLVDIYRGEFPAQRSLFKVALYKTFFPQLIAGPIVRYKDVKDRLSDRPVRLADLSSGTIRFVLGLAQKVLIANTVGGVADQIFALPEARLGAASAWLAGISYTFQIYYDFAGYSNMAIGLGQIFGFHFLENFDSPYIARSITDFWRRWHISLSTWFRDYLFIPLGGSRGSRFRNFLNLYVVFFLCGLWHGASWNFVIWGLFHGTLLVLEKTRFGFLLKKVPRVLQHVYTMLMVLMGWILFRTESLAQSGLFLKTMFGGGTAGPYHTPWERYCSPEFLLAIAAAILFSGAFSLAGDLKDAFTRPAESESNGSQESGSRAALGYGLQFGALVLLFVLSLSYLAANTFNPFIYFRF